MIVTATVSSVKIGPGEMIAMVQPVPVTAPMVNCTGAPGWVGVSVSELPGILPSIEQLAEFADAVPVKYGGVSVTPAGTAREAVIVALLPLAIDSFCGETIIDVKSDEAVLTPVALAVT